MKLKRKIVFLMFVFLFFMIPTVRAASEVKGTASHAKMRTGPSTNFDRTTVSDGTQGVANGEVTILDTVAEAPVNSDCASDKWYKISSGDLSAPGIYTSYVCSDNVSNVHTNDSTPAPTPAANNDSIASNYKVVAYGTTSANGRVALVNPKSGSDNTGCTAYRALIDNQIKCLSASQLSNIQNVSVLDTNAIAYDYNAELAKFPENYRGYINTVHSLHPNWRFYAYNTNLDWNYVVNSEKNAGLISPYNDSTYYDASEGANYNWRTNTFTKHGGDQWYTPSKIATSYFLDPRSYMVIDNLGIDGYDFKRLFAFEDSREYTYHNSQSIDKMLYYGKLLNATINTPSGVKTYNQAFTDGASFTSISSMMLIARSRNETANFKSGSVNGTYTNPDTHISYAGYYNFFNVGSYGAAPVTNGLIYAQKMGWNNQYKSIVDGSVFIGTKYIYNGQETPYFQKFNVSPYTLTAKLGHQYQSNIQAPITESGYVFWGYKDSKNIDQPIVFHIPVYNNMPALATPQPKNGNPNNWLADLKVNGQTLDGFNGDNYYSYDDNWDGQADDIFPTNVYHYTMDWDKDTINIAAPTILDSAKVSGVGNVRVEKSTVLDVVVTAGNGTTKTYKIDITKQDAPKTNEDGTITYPKVTDVLNQIGIKYNDNYMSGMNIDTPYEVLINAITKKNNLVKTTVDKNGNNRTNHFATGDVIHVRSGNETKSYTYILYGDLNGDGSVDLLDLVNCRNIILNTSNLSTSYRKASDVNRDGRVDLIDLVMIRNNILGSPINQN